MLKVGGEVDGFCTKCEMTLGVHRFRGDVPGTPARRPNGGSGTAAARAARPGREHPVTLSFEQALREKNLAMSQRYSPRGTYQVDQVLEAVAGDDRVGRARGGNDDIGGDQVLIEFFQARCLAFELRCE